MLEEIINDDSRDKHISLFKIVERMMKKYLLACQKGKYLSTTIVKLKNPINFLKYHNFNIGGFFLLKQKITLFTTSNLNLGWLSLIYQWNMQFREPKNLMNREILPTHFYISMGGAETTLL
jgi:hypothetical protein